MIFTITDPGQCKVGDIILPGVFESLEITGSVQTDEAEIKGKKNRVTQAVGYTNMRMRLNLAIHVLNDEEDPNDQIAQQIKIIQNIFRKSPSQEVPGVYRFVNKHAQARGINEVIFAEFKTYEDNRIDKVICGLEFVEHVPVNVKIATSETPRASTASKAAAGGQTPKPAPQPTTAGFRQLEQESIKNMNKTKKTPAKDKREPGFGKKLINWLRGKDIG